MKFQTKPTELKMNETKWKESERDEKKSEPNEWTVKRTYQRENIINKHSYTHTRAHNHRSTREEKK